MEFMQPRNITKISLSCLALILVLHINISGSANAVPQVEVRAHDDAYEYLCQLTEAPERFRDGSGALWVAAAADSGAPVPTVTVLPFRASDGAEYSPLNLRMEPLEADGKTLTLRIYNASADAVSVVPTVWLEVKLSDGWYNVPFSSSGAREFMLQPGKSLDTAVGFTAGFDREAPLPAGSYRARVAAGEGYVYAEFELLYENGVYTVAGVEAK